MKGLIFTEFLEYVESRSSYEIVDKIIMKTKVSENGAYTSLGTYNIQELLQLVTAYGEETKQTNKEVLIEFGQYLFKKFISYYPYLFKQTFNTFQFLNSVENYVHIEVNKLYPEAELPRFECKLLSNNKFVMIYSSNRPLADLAEGLIRGCIEYHHEQMEIIREDMIAENGYKSKFTLIKNSSARVA